jgi:hypothetical protein
VPDQDLARTGRRNLDLDHPKHIRAAGPFGPHDAHHIGHGGFLSAAGLA